MYSKEMFRIVCAFFGNFFSFFFNLTKIQICMTDDFNLTAPLPLSLSVILFVVIFQFAFMNLDGATESVQFD